MTQSEAEFVETTESLESALHDIGYTETQIIDSTDDPADTDVDEEGVDQRLVVLVNADAGPDFVIVAEKSNEFFQVQSTYGLWKELADQLSQEQIDELVPDEYVDELPEEHPVRAQVPPELRKEDDERLAITAAFELLENLDVDTRRKLIYRLSDIFTTAETKHVVDSTSPDGGVSGFTAFYKIFPYEEQFSLQELNDVVERVRMSTHRATMFLRYSFNIGVDISRSTAGDATDPSVPEESGAPVELD